MPDDRAPSGGRESCRFCENAIRYQDGWRLETSSEESSYRCGANRGLHAPKYRAPSGDLSEGRVEADERVEAAIQRVKTKLKSRSYSHTSAPNFWRSLAQEVLGAAGFQLQLKRLDASESRAAGLPEMEAALREVREWAAENELAEPPLDWKRLGEILNK